MDLKKENKELKEHIIVLKNYCNVLKKKNQIQKDRHNVKGNYVLDEMMPRKNENPI